MQGTKSNDEALFQELLEKSKYKKPFLRVLGTWQGFVLASSGFNVPIGPGNAKIFASAQEKEV